MESIAKRRPFLKSIYLQTATPLITPPRLSLFYRTYISYLTRWNVPIIPNFTGSSNQTECLLTVTTCFLCLPSSVLTRTVTRPSHVHVTHAALWQIIISGFGKQMSCEESGARCSWIPIPCPFNFLLAFIILACMLYDVNLAIMGLDLFAQSVTAVNISVVNNCVQLTGGKVLDNFISVLAFLFCSSSLVRISSICSCWSVGSCCSAFSVDVFYFLVYLATVTSLIWFIWIFTCQKSTGSETKLYVEQMLLKCPVCDCVTASNSIPAHFEFVSGVI